MMPTVEFFRNEPCFTISRVVSDLDAKQCAIMDTVADFGLNSGCISTAPAGYRDCSGQSPRRR